MIASDGIIPSRLPTNNQVDDAFFQSELRYRRLFESAKDGILILDAATGDVVDANPFLLELLGYSLEEMVGKRLWDIGPFKDIAASESAFAELQANEYIRYENLPLETKSGSRREVEFISNAYLVEHNRFIQCNIRDISDRKQEDKERTRLADILDEWCLHEIYFYDEETLRFAYVNEGGQRNLGYTLDQLLALTVLDIRPEFDKASFQAMVAPLLRNEETTHIFQTIQRRADGTVYPVEVRLQLLERKGTRLWVSIALDITDRQKSEQALRESEERFRLLVERSPDAIFVHCEGKVVFANPATWVLFGEERSEQVVGRDVMEIMHPASGAVIQERIRHAEAGEVTPLVAQKLIRLDGVVVEVEAMGIGSVFDGKPAVQIILRDITEKKQIEAQALRSQRMESIGALAAGIAHDLNNALAPILMASTLLRTTRTESEAHVMADIIKGSAQHAADMVKQVLTFTRGTADERSLVNIGVLMDEIEGIARHTFPLTVELRTDIAPGVWPVAGNPTQLHQVLLNLCINSRDAMPHGGILTLSASNIQVDHTVVGLPSDGLPGPYLRLAVTDSGTGMSPEVLAHIFEPFYTTKASGHGTGLGLSTVNTIIKAHGGFLHVQSTIDRGTEFQIYLPAMMEEISVVEVESTPPPMGAGQWILLVDDEAAIRSILSLTLKSYGYRVAVASGGPQAVALCAQEPLRFQLLIVDMNMPIMDGAATILTIRTLAPQIKVIATSGTRSHLAKMEALDADGFLSKPFSYGEVLKTVHTALHESQVASAPNG